MKTFQQPIIAYAIIRSRRIKEEKDDYLRVMPLSISTKAEEGDPIDGFQMGDNGDLSRKDEVVGVVPAAPGTVGFYDCSEETAGNPVIKIQIPGIRPSLLK